MAVSSNGNNLGGLSRGGNVLARPVSAPTQPNSAPTITAPAQPTTPTNIMQAMSMGLPYNNIPTQPAPVQQPAPKQPVYTPPPPPQYTPQFDSNVTQLYGANPLNLLGGNVSNMSQAMNQINQNRAALGSNFMNNNGIGSSGTFSPVVTGQNFQSSASPLSSLLNYINILGANRSNNYSS